MSIARDYALSFLGVPYKFGGSNPIDGIDCSGLVCEVLKSQGLLGHGEDLSAQGLFDRYKALGKRGVFEPGALIFFGQDERSICHVGILLTNELMIEAGGGDSHTLTHDDAAKRNAFVKVRPSHYRKDFLTTVKLNYDF